MSEFIKPKDIPVQKDDLVINCMDHRFQQSARERMMELFKVDVDASDRLILGGSSKRVVDGILIPQIQLSHKLHEIKNVYVIDHSDCGGFGGLAAYEGDEQKEIQAHFESLAQAQEGIHKILPQLVVTTFVLNMEGEAVFSQGQASVLD